MKPRPSNCRILLILLVLWPFSVKSADMTCVGTTSGIDSMETATVSLLNDQGKPLNFEVRVADDAVERAAGFQHVCPNVIDDTLILFVYPVELDAQFHMRNVHAPLDIAFFDRNGQLVKKLLMQRYTDASEPLYDPGGAFQFALEAREGFFDQHGITMYPSRLVAVQ